MSWVPQPHTLQASELPEAPTTPTANSGVQVQDRAKGTSPSGPPRGKRPQTPCFRHRHLPEAATVHSARPRVFANCTLGPLFGEKEGGKPMGQSRTYMELNSIPNTMRRLRGAPRQPTTGTGLLRAKVNYRLHLRGPSWRRLGRLVRITGGATVVSQCSATGTESWIKGPAWWSGETHALVTAANWTQIS